MALRLFGDGRIEEVSELEIEANTAINIPLTLIGATGQTANILEVKNDSDTVVAKIESNGDLEAVGGAFSGTVELPETTNYDGTQLSTTLAAKLDLAGGKILQIVRATDGTNRTTTSTSFVDVTGMSVTITPTKSTSAVLIILSVYNAAPSNDTCSLAIADSSNNLISGAERLGLYTSSGSIEATTVGFAYATPATTSAVTYKARFRSQGGTHTIFNSINTGQMYAIEVSA